MRPLTVSQVAEMVGVSVGTVHRWTEAGILSAFRTVGGHRRYHQRAVETAMQQYGLQRKVHSGPPRVLVVDDDEHVRSGLALELENDYDVRTAADGYQAGRELSSFHPDLVVLDLMMDGLDGFQVCRDIKTSPELSHTRVLVLTGYASDEHTERARACGADDVLSKPVSGPALRRAMEALILYSTEVHGSACM